MNNLKQKRHLLPLCRGVVAFFVLCLSASFLSAQVSHSFGQIPVGNSDTNGFVRVDKVFCDLALGNGRSAELFFKFSSDPRQEPKYLGAYWTIPFFDSNVVKLSANRYRWIAPNLRPYTFNKAQKAERGYKETYILNTTGKLKLNIAKDDSICIENVDDSRNRYLLKNGRLVSFCEGKNADTFRISYGNANRPHVVYNVGKNSTEIEFAYNKEGFLTKIVFPNDKKALFITYSECDTFAEDGITKQGKLLKSISSIKFVDGHKEEYRYSAESNKKNRNILTKNETEKASANVPINKFEQRIREDNKGFIEWDATTGIIVSDSGGEYAVRNPIFDKYSTEYGDDYFVTSRKREIKTKESRISYKKPENKYAEIWDYSLRTAVRIEQNPHTGEQTRTSYIGTPGNASMKIRKIEKKISNKTNWNIISTRIYNNNGNIIRENYGNGNIKEFIYDKKNQHIKTIDNGKLIYKNSDVNDNGIIYLKRINENYFIKKTMRNNVTEVFIVDKAGNEIKIGVEDNE